MSIGDERVLQTMNLGIQKDNRDNLNDMRRDAINKSFENEDKKNSQSSSSKSDSSSNSESSSSSSTKSNISKNTPHISTNHIDFFNVNTNNTVISTAVINGEPIKNNGDKVTIIGGNSNDKIEFSKASDGVIFGNGFKDIIYVTNGSERNSVFGGDGDDIIHVDNSDSNVIYGGNGSDLINLYGSNNTIIGGKGEDTICLNDSSNTVIIYNSEDGNDYIQNFYDGSTILYLNCHSYTASSYGPIYADNGIIKIQGTDICQKVNPSGTSKPAVSCMSSINILASKLDTLASSLEKNDGSSSSKSTSTSASTSTATSTTINPAINPKSTITSNASKVQISDERMKHIAGLLSVGYDDDNTPTSTPTVASGNSGNGTVVVNNYYGDYHDNSGNNGTIINNSSVDGDVTNNTSVDNSKTIVISGNTWTYSGGDKVINNYKQGEVVKLASDYQGIDLKGNSFFVKSSSGQLEIQNSRDKFIGYSAGDDNNVAAYSYVASGGGDVDGRGKSQAEIMIGGDNANNQIYAGNGGSSLWGGNGGNDVMTGGDGYDEFFYANGSGGDVIKNASSDDVVNLLGVTLNQIIGYSYDDSCVVLNFKDGGSLRVEGNSGVSYKLQDTTYVCNQTTGEWTTK